jgi:hypothetical protein
LPFGFICVAVSGDDGRLVIRADRYPATPPPGRRNDSVRVEVPIVIYDPKLPSENLYTDCAASG